MKKLSILGSTGSIGQSTLDVIGLHQDRFEIVGLAEGHDVELLAKQIAKFRPKLVSVKDETSARVLKELIVNPPSPPFFKGGIASLPPFAKGGRGDLKCHLPEIMCGVEGACQVASMSEADIVVSAIVGAAGLVPTIEAIKKGKRIALANKETMVIAGGLVRSLAKKHDALIIPVDSEHSAIYQSLAGHRAKDVTRLILTASGGPFLNFSKSQIEKVTIAEALNHPRWKMGNKITIDSATLMNKGLEVIEASFLFGMPHTMIDVVIHPESIIHSMVEYKDGCVIGELGVPDMRAPIAYALAYPERISTGVEKIDFRKVGKLTFETPDQDKFPCLKLAYDALKSQGSKCLTLNAANEVAVAAFLDKKISFTAIAQIVEKTMQAHDCGACTTLEEILEADKQARKIASHYL